MTATTTNNYWWTTQRLLSTNGRSLGPQYHHWRYHNLPPLSALAAAAAAAAAGVAVALVIPQQERDRDTASFPCCCCTSSSSSSSWRVGSGRLTSSSSLSASSFSSSFFRTVQCQESSSSSLSSSSSSRRTSSRSGTATSVPQELEGNTDTYVPLSLPDRALVTSHAIFGPLLGKRDLIESYRPYKLRAVNENTRRGDVVVAIAKLGTGLDGHEGIVHGGIVALLIDDVLGFSYESLSVPYAVTANLNLNYRSPVPAGSSVLITTTLLHRTDRKLVWNVSVTSTDEERRLYCEATSVFVIPRERKLVDPQPREEEDIPSVA